MSGREFKKGRETQADPWLQRFRKRTDLNGLEFVDFSYTYTKKLEPFSKTLAHNQIGYENYLKKTPQELSNVQGIFTVHHRVRNCEAKSEAKPNS